MAPKKKISGMIKLQIQAGQANPAPPVGPALGQHGVNIMDFCKAYNAATENQRGQVIGVIQCINKKSGPAFTLEDMQILDEFSWQVPAPRLAHDADDAEDADDGAAP